MFWLWISINQCYGAGADGAEIIWGSVAIQYMAGAGAEKMDKVEAENK